MASGSTILSPRPLDLAPVPSLSELDQLCSGPLDSFLEEATRLNISTRRHSSSSGSSAHTHAAHQRPPRASRQGGAAGSGKAGSTNVKAHAAAAAAAAAAPAAAERLAKLRAANEVVRNSWQFKATGSVKAAAVLASLHARRLASGGPEGLAAQAAALIAAHNLDDTTYLYDLGNTTRLFQAWRGALPRVEPFYAVKCNPEPGLLKLLAALGAGFDCASRAELEAVLALGVPPSRIIFAHPCKRSADLRFARDAGVMMTTFDTEGELVKIAAAHPGIQLVLRVRCDDPEARCQLGLKYGADPAEAPRLLAAAAALGLAVIGASFHVGSGCKNLATYAAAIATARAVFDAGAAAGHAMSLLDIGGGFTGRFDGHGHVMFGELARTINAALSVHFPATAAGGASLEQPAVAGAGSSGSGGAVRVIAEPGRFFAEASAALLVPVYGTRDRPAQLPGGGAGVHKDYWLTDGLYGSFNCILYDDQKPQPLVLRSPLLPPLPDEEGAAAPGARLFPSTLWGPTCDSADYLYKGIPLPELRTGDWLLFVNAGAYTVAGACDFNGIAMSQPTKHFVFSAKAVDDSEEEDEEAGEEASSSSGSEGDDGSDDDEEGGGTEGAPGTAAA